LIVEVPVAPDATARWRCTIKSALATTIARAHDHGLAAALARGAERPLVLGYHRVVEDFEAESQSEMPSMLTSRAMFEHHLECLGRRFQFVSLDEIGERLASGRTFSRPVAAITFDDGYQDVYENAFPILKKKGIPAAMFVVTDLVDRPFWQIHDKFYHLVAKAFATWDDPRHKLSGLLADLGLPQDQLTPPPSTRTPLLAVSSLLPALSQTDVFRVMEGIEASVGNGFHNVPKSVTWEMLHDMRRGGFTVGSHTRTHVTLPMESAETVAGELTGSKAELERRLGERVDHFCYPGGQFTAEVVAAVGRAGYKYGYTACPHDVSEHPMLTIERLLLWEGSSVDGAGRFSADILNCQVHDLWPPARRCERVHHP
jgi:peptidoglycan/xylan/chitin deacetylase (PgdA/CDA1 family)